jgi:hypothetical protein
MIQYTSRYAIAAVRVCILLPGVSERFAAKWQKRQRHLNRRKHRPCVGLGRRTARTALHLSDNALGALYVTGVPQIGSTIVSD